MIDNLITNEDVQKALSIKQCLNVMEESYREQAAVGRSTAHLHPYLPHWLFDVSF